MKKCFPDGGYSLNTNKLDLYGFASLSYLNYKNYCILVFFRASLSLTATATAIKEIISN
jgi:hypothetical protein